MTTLEVITQKTAAAQKAAQDAREAIGRLNADCEKREKEIAGLMAEIKALDGEISDTIAKGGDATKLESKFSALKQKKSEQSRHLDKLRGEILPAARKVLTTAEIEVTTSLHKAVLEAAQPYQERAKAALGALYQVFTEWLDIVDSVSKKERRTLSGDFRERALSTSKFIFDNLKKPDEQAKFKSMVRMLDTDLQRAKWFGK